MLLLLRNSLLALLEGLCARFNRILLARTCTNTHTHTHHTHVAGRQSQILRDYDPDHQLKRLWH